MRWYLNNYLLVIRDGSPPMRHRHEPLGPRGCSHALSQRSILRQHLIFRSESLQDDGILDSLFQVADELFFGQCLEDCDLFHSVTEWAA